MCTFELNVMGEYPHQNCNVLVFGQLEIVFNDNRRIVDNFCKNLEKI